MTAVELITAMAISSVLGLMTLYVFLGLNSASSSTVQRSLSASQARVILSSWNSLLDVAESPLRSESDFPAFETVSANQVTFYASLNNRTSTNDVSLPVKVKILSSGGQVIEERYVPTAGGWPSTPTVRRILASRAAATFSAVDANGTAVGWSASGYAKYCQSATTPAVASAGICSTVGCSPAPAVCTGVAGANALLSQVRNVRISLSVTDSLGATHMYGGPGATVPAVVSP